MNAPRPALASLDYRPDIDGLRALAVLAVLLFHYFPNQLPGGFTGVDVFFVISGFLITGWIAQHHAEDGFSYRQFYARRVRRLFPALAAVLAGCLLAGWFILWGPEYASLGARTAFGAAFLGNAGLRLDSGYFDLTSIDKPLLHLWSLGVEEQFYALWPAVLWLAWRRQWNLARTCAVTALFSLGINGYLLAAHQNHLAFYLPFSRFWELMVGGWLAVRRPSLPTSFAWPCAVMGATMIGVGFRYSSAGNYPDAWALLPTIGTACVIAAGKAHPINQRLLGWRPLVALGLISYPLYLWHWPILCFVHAVSNQLMPDVSLRLLAIAASLLLAGMTYRWLERPLRYRPGRVVPWLAATMLVLGMAGAAIALEEGVPARYAHSDYHRILDAQPDILDPNPVTALAQTPPFRYHPVEWGDFFTSGIAPEQVAPDTIAVIGDSHAGRVFIGLRQAGLQNSSYVGRWGCAPLLGIEETHIENGGSLYCQPGMDRLLHFVAAHPAFQIAVLSDYHLIYGQWETLQDAASGTPASYATGLERSVALLADGKRQVVIALDVPSLPYECVMRPFPVWGRVDRSRCRIPRDDYRQQQQQMQEIAAKLAAHYPQVSVFDPSSLFCNRTECGEINPDHALYSYDGHHLSFYGTQRLGVALRDFMQHLPTHY